MAHRWKLPFRQQWQLLELDEISKHEERKSVINTLLRIETNQGYPSLKPHAALLAFKAEIMHPGNLSQLPEFIAERLDGPLATDASRTNTLRDLSALFSKYRADRNRELKNMGLTIESAQGTEELRGIKAWLLGLGIEGIPNPEPASDEVGQGVDDGPGRQAGG